MVRKAREAAESELWEKERLEALRESIRLENEWEERAFHEQSKNKII